MLNTDSLHYCFPSLGNKVRRMKNKIYYMAVKRAVQTGNTKILQFDWFISGWIFPALSAQGGKFKNGLPGSNKN